MRRYAHLADVAILATMLVLVVLGDIALLAFAGRVVYLGHCASPATITLWTIALQGAVIWLIGLVVPTMRRHWERHRYSAHLENEFDALL